MGLQIRTYVNGNQELIELFGNEDIDLEISFAEIQDITKKNSAFTKEFRVPGSKNNNYIFNYFYDINAVALDWNPKRKFEADLLYDGFEIYNGYVRLNTVSINKIEKIYSITFYSAVGDLAANIGDKALCNVDTSSLNHSLYDTDISARIFLDPSLHPPSALGGNAITENPVNTGDVRYILGQRGYDYTGTTYGNIRDIDTAQTPILDFSGISGFFDYYQTPLISSYLIPSIRTRKLYELIVNQAGYEIQSDFFSTDYFGRYYIPLSFNSDQPYMAESEEYRYQFVNTSGYTNQYNTYKIESTGGSYLNVDLLKARNITQENLGFNPVVYSNYSAFTPAISAFTDYVFALPFTNGNPLTYELTISNVYTGSTSCPNPPSCGDFIGDMYLMKYNYNSGSTMVVETIASVPFYGFNSFSGQSNTYYYTGTTTPYGEYNGTDLYVLGYTFNQPNWYISGASFKVLSSPEVLPKTIELYKEMSCDQKQVEFIQNINKTFNLVVVEHPIKPKTIIVEPMINYIGKGQTLDWTDKVDYDSTQTLRPTTNIINGSIFLANKQDKDYINSEYNKKTNNIFGQRFIDLGIDYKNADINLVQTLGQNTDYYLNASGSTNIALPCYFISKETNTNGKSNFEYRPFRSLPRQVFMSVPIPSGNTGQPAFFYRYQGTNSPFTVIGLEGFNCMPNVNRLTTYPFAVSGFSHYTIYNQENVFTPDELIYPEVESMYDRYYRDYVEDLISEENKIYNCKMYLTPWEVSNLYFNETIVIKNAKFRINKISNLSLLEPGLCDVELVKLTRNYTSTPTLFYDLVSCDDPCIVYHSHTDLSYLLWAFENQVVDLQFNYFEPTGKYKVIRTDYNPDYQYITPYFSYSANTSSGYFVFTDFLTFDDCADTSINNRLNIYNDFTGSTYSGDCYGFTITNTGYNTATFTFTNCNGDPSSWTLAPSGTINVCGLYGTFDTSGFDSCVTGLTECTGSTPLPTPTPTNTPGLSPTPTTTPSATIGLTPTPSQTGTPAPTPALCKEDTIINVIDTGWIKFELCDGTTDFLFLPTLGSFTLSLCIQQGTIRAGIPFADLAIFSITSTGTSC